MITDRQTKDKIGFLTGKGETIREEKTQRKYVWETLAGGVQC